MAATTISRATLTDSTSPTTGDIWNAALVGTALYDKIDLLFTADLRIERSTSGDITLAVAGASNTAGSDAIFFATVAGSSAGDPVAQFNVSGIVSYTMGIDNDDSDLFKVVQSSALTTTSALVLDGSGHVFINDNADVDITTGLTINQGAADNNILSFKSSDITHGITSLVETDTYGYFRKQSATAGGLRMDGLSEVTTGMEFVPIHTTDDTTKTSAGLGTLNIDCYLKSGTTIAAPGANANIVSFRAGGTTRFILDSDGDSHQDVGTAWTNFDEHDDLALLHALSAGVSQDGDPLRHAFAGLLEQYRDTLAANRIVTFNDDGHHFINWSRANMLLIGAVRQLGAQVQQLKKRLPA